MTRLYDFASRLSGCLAGVCAVLALLATPSSARADDLSDCQQCCEGQDPEHGAIYDECVTQCMQGAGACGFAAQCPSIIQNGKYISCVNPGGQCIFGGVKSTCGDSKGKVLCTCLQPPPP